MFYKIIAGDCIVAIGTGSGGEQITESQYGEILAMLRSRPDAPDGFAYRLTASLEWELYELPPVEEAEPTEEAYAEAGKILLGVSQ